MILFLAMAAAIGTSCTAIDGDTLRCGPAGAERIERVRLIGIDAPELPGHCARWRKCVAGDAWASKAALARLVEGQKVELRRLGQDRYGRTLAIATVGGINLSCAMVRAGQAIYVPKWDRSGAANCR